MARQAISKRTRFEVFKRDGFRCVYCGATAAAAELRVDHVIPVALGGDSSPGNLVTACVACNAGKSDVALDESRLHAAEELAARDAKRRDPANTVEFWRDGEALYIPRSLSESRLGRLKHRGRGAKKRVPTIEAIEAAWGCDLSLSPAEFFVFGVRVLVHAGRPPAERAA